MVLKFSHTNFIAMVPWNLLATESAVTLLGVVMTLCTIRSLQKYENKKWGEDFLSFLQILLEI